MPAPPIDLDAWLAAIARAAPQAQAALDAAWESDLLHWCRGLGATLNGSTPHAAAADAIALLAATAPLRQAITRYELEVRAQLRTDAARRFAIGVRPLELGWEAVHGAMTTSASRFAVTIEAVPLPGASPPSADAAGDATAPPTT
jgi:hypothetical protein